MTNNANTVAVLIGIALLVAACAKREAQAPAPDERTAAAAPPAALPQDEETAHSNAGSWPGAKGAGGAAEGAGQSEIALGDEKKSASGHAPRAQSAPAEALRERRAENAASGPARPAPVKPKSNAALEEPAKSKDEALADWGHSVELLEQSLDQFQHALELATPDCPAAEKFRQTVCTLAERICSLEEQLPTTTKRRCQDGRQRCEQAGQKYRARCDKE